MNWQSFSTGAVLVLGIALVVGVGFAFTLLGTAEQTAVHPTDEPGFVVDVHADGNATVAVTYAYNLSDADRTEAFSDLQDSESSRAHFRDEFESRLRDVAANASARVDRNMSVSDAAIQLETVDDTGVVTVSVAWHNLAGHDGDALVVTEPFASGFYPDRPFYVVLPSEYTVSSATPTPANATDGSLQWDAGTDLTGFELVVSAPSDDGTTDDTDGNSTSEDADDGSTDGTDDGSTDGTDDGSTDGTEDTDDGGRTDEGGDSQDGDADGGNESGVDATDGTNDTDDGVDGGADDDGPGFGFLLALLALAATVMARQ